MSKTIDEALVKNMTIYESIKDLIHCSICCCIVLDPQQCDSCQNIFCKICITDWQKKSKTCPMKCLDFTFKDSRIIRNVLSRLIFKCALNCPKEINYDDYFTHQESCENGKTECPCCKTIVSRRIVGSNPYEVKIKALQEEINKLKNPVNAGIVLPKDYIPDLFNNKECIFATSGGNFLRTITAKNPCPNNFVIKILMKKLKYPGHVSIGLSEKILKENKGYLGGDMGTGNWGLAGNGSLGEQGKWAKGYAYAEGDVLTIYGNEGTISYKINHNSETKNYSYNLSNNPLYFGISFFYEGDILQLI